MGRRLLGLDPGQDFNAAHLVLQRQALSHPHATALTWRTFDGGRQEFTFTDLRDGAARFAARLDALDLPPTAPVVVLLDPGPGLAQALLGAIWAGAIACPLFSALGSDAITARLDDCSAAVVITSGSHCAKLDRALGTLATRPAVVVCDDDGGKHGATADRPCTRTRAEDPMLLHYSSGTTGQPKGVVHVHAALPGIAATARVVLDLHPGDVYWCTADPGWVTGSCYGLLGPWSLGTHCVTYTGGFSPEAWYGVIAAERVTVWYTSPTALRMLMRAGEDVARAHDLSSLRHICSVGEPLNAEVIRWGRRVLGREIHDTWWQTETGCIQIANYPFMPVRPGSMGRPFAGVQAAIISPESGRELPPGLEGVLALRPPWPSMFRAYLGRPDLYAARFRDGWYLTGDRARQDQDGYFWFVGRDDDVINTSGHLVGPFEVESALLEHPAVVEAAAFGVPADDVGEAVAAQVVLAPGQVGSRELARELRTRVRRHVGPFAVPREIAFAAHLPRTRSGKIMRRVARAAFLDLPTGDLSALEDDDRAR